MKLYEIPAEATQLELLLIEAEGELTPELEAHMKALVEGGKEKLENAACVVRSLEAQKDACLVEAKRLAERAKSLEANADRLKALMLSAVDGAFGGKVKTDLFTIWGQTSAKSASFTYDGDLMKLPDTFVKFHAPELDTGALYRAWRAKEAIPEGVSVEEKDGTRFLRIK